MRWYSRRGDWWEKDRGVQGGEELDTRMWFGKYWSGVVKMLAILTLRGCRIALLDTLRVVRWVWSIAGGSMDAPMPMVWRNQHILVVRYVLEHVRRMGGLNLQYRLSIWWCNPFG